MQEEKGLRHLQIRNAVLKFDRWHDLQEAIQQQDNQLVDELVSQLAKLIDAHDFPYVKRTFDIRDDLLERLRIYCVRNNLKQKTVINIALENLLQWKDI